jgi:hypothetical protein
VNKVFKSTKEFEAAMLVIALKLRDGFTTIDQLQQDTGLAEDDFHEAMQQAIRLGYVTGISYQSGIGGQYALSILDPKVTYVGLTFIENSDTL